MDMHHEEPPEGNVRPMTTEEEDSIDRYNTPGAAAGKIPKKMTPAGQYEIADPHERLVGEALELTAGLFRAQTGLEPTVKYTTAMRNTFEKLDDYRLSIEVEKLEHELTLVRKK